MCNSFVYSFKITHILLLFVTIISGQESCNTPEAQEGFCVSYKECPLVKDLLQLYGSNEAIPKHFSNQILKSKCSRDNEPIRLCCKLSNNFIKPAPPPTTAPFQENPKLIDGSVQTKDLISQFNLKIDPCFTPDLQRGFCVPYKECPFVKELLQTYGSNDAIPNYFLDIILKSKCSRDNEPIRLCCKLSKNFTIPTPPPTTAPIQANPKLTEGPDSTKDLISPFKSKGEACTTPALRSGFCVSFEECPLVKQLLQSYGSNEEIPKHFLNQIFKSKCSPDNEPIRLCCTLPNNFLLPKSPTPTTTTTTPVQTNVKLTEEVDNTKDLISPTNPNEETCITPASQNGFCVPYDECTPVKDLLTNFENKEAVPQYYLDYIFKSKCSRDNEPIRLCCNLANNSKRSIPTTVATPVQNDPKLTVDLDYKEDFMSQFNPKGLSILSQLDCGDPEGNRVVGGKEAKLAAFPWMALLRYDLPSNEFKCGGSLISNRYVLTAAHCVNEQIYTVVGVRLGEHDLTTNPDCRGLQQKACNPVIEDFGIEKIILHPSYNKSKHINDIALLKLNGTVEFKKHIKPVCLPITQSAFELNSNDFTIAGWGATEKNRHLNSNVLMKAFVQGQISNVCQEKFKIEINPKKHICAADIHTGRDTCEGDSGGPLVALNKYLSEKRYIQYGIVASGGGNCNLEQKFPGLYTNVLTFIPWITNIIVE